MTLATDGTSNGARWAVIIRCRYATQNLRRLISISMIRKMNNEISVGW